MPFKLDHCDKPFVIESKHTPHRKMHSGEKQFKCDHCDKTFLLKTKLTCHQKTQIGTKPF